MVRLLNVPHLATSITVEHSLVRLVGICEGSDGGFLSISAKGPDGKECAPQDICMTTTTQMQNNPAAAHGGNSRGVGFIAWVLLKSHGKHSIVISDAASSDPSSAEISLTVLYPMEPEVMYQKAGEMPPAQGLHRCELFYVVPPAAEREDGIEGPPSVDCTAKGAVDLIRMSGLLLQTFVFEDLKNGRTFLLGMEAPGVPRVNIFRLPMSMAEYHALGDHWKDGGQAGHAAVKECCEDFIKANFPESKEVIKKIAWSGPSRFNPQTNKIVGHTALGGGDLALFGTSTLHCSPNCVADIPAAFTDKSLFSPDLLDDSGGRGRVRCWTAATGIGAQQHELGHAFGCPHTPTGIMARGFDDYDCFAVATDRSFPPSSPGVYDPKGAHFHKETKRLHTHQKYFYDDSPNSLRTKGGFILTAPAKAFTLEVSLGLEDDDDETDSLPSLPPPAVAGGQAGARVKKLMVHAIWRKSDGANLFVLHDDPSRGVSTGAGTARTLTVSECGGQTLLKHFDFDQVSNIDLQAHVVIATDTSRNMGLKIDATAVYLDFKNEGNFTRYYEGSWTMVPTSTVFSQTACESGQQQPRQGPPAFHHPGGKFELTNGGTRLVEYDTQGKSSFVFDVLDSQGVAPVGPRNNQDFISASTPPVTSAAMMTAVLALDRSRGMYLLVDQTSVRYAYAAPHTVTQATVQGVVAWNGLYVGNWK